MDLYDTVKIPRNRRHEHQMLFLQTPCIVKNHFRQLMQPSRKVRMMRPVLSCGCTEDAGRGKTVRRSSNRSFGNLNQLLQIQRIRKRNESSGICDLPFLAYTGKLLDIKNEALKTCNDHSSQRRKNMQDRRVNKVSLQIREIKRKLRKQQEVAKILQEKLMVVAERTIKRKANSRMRNNLPHIYINSLSRVRSNTYSDFESIVAKEPLQRRKVRIRIPFLENPLNCQEKISQSFI